MKEKIFAFLKTKIGSHAGGIQDNYLQGIAEAYGKTITEEAQIATIFTDATLESLKSVYSSIQPEIDRRAEAKTKAELKAFQEKHGLGEDGLPIKKPEVKPIKKKKAEDDDDDEQPAWAKQILADQAELKSKIALQEKEKTTAILSEKVKSHEKLKGIPPSFLKGRNLNVESEDKINELVTTLETDWNTFKQEQAELGVHWSIPADPGGKLKEGETLGKSLAEKRNANSSDGVKGKTV